MTGWHKESMLCFDLETTGTDVEDDRIVTACVGLIRPGYETEIRATVVNPGIEVPEAAAAVHGYTTERVRAEGKDPAEEIEWVTADLASALRASVPVVGMNCVFDLTILDRECRRLGLATLEERIGGPITPVVDVYTIDKALDRYRKGKRKLTDLCEHYAVRIDGAHDATFDALAAARVAYRMGQRSQMEAQALRALYADRRYPNEFVGAWQAFGRMTLAELHEAQVRWYAEQSEGLGDYWRGEAYKAAQRAERAAERFDASDDPAVRAEADEERIAAEMEAADLTARIASLSPHWPIRPVEAVTAP